MGDQVEPRKEFIVKHALEAEYRYLGLVLLLKATYYFLI